MDIKFLQKLIIAFSLGTLEGLLLGWAMFGKDILISSISHAFVQIYLFICITLTIKKNFFN